ncbi:synaptotagmin-2 isoform X2 [Sphaeramia orbicularis]|uniref:Synaptotagmin-2-like n=1 Tax=Sphaeramia orbicularis TaxID=375764 RepID=A0A672ZXY7_9TELE|nr:synaptotagmin-2-like isoform X2 [Sphaeramia orbicularis]
MVTLMDYLGPVGALSASVELRMPFPEPVKYLILGVSVTLLLMALGILVWQTFRCCTQTYATHTGPDPVCDDLLRSGPMWTSADGSTGEPSTKVEDVSAQVHRLSRCLLEASVFHAPEECTDKQITPEKVCGSLRFSVFFDRLQSRLVVTVLQVEGLEEHHPTRTLQPFVRLRLMWAGAEGEETEGSKDEEGKDTPPGLWAVLQEWRSRIVKGSCNPLFGDQFSCTLQGDKELHRIALRMEVRDFDKFSRHVVLGEVRKPLGQINVSYPLELQEELKAPQKDLVGEVLLSLKFLPTSQRLEVGLLKVRLVLVDISSEAALCARISVQWNQCKLRHHKTSVLSYSLVTVFNQVFLFSLPELPLEQCKILVSVYAKDAARKSAKRLIGQLTVGKQKHSEDKHWSLMMHSVRQPTAMWHGLLL